MNEKLMQYLDRVFAPYEDLHTIRDFKEELFNDLQEKYDDLKNQGYGDEEAYRITVDSIGDITQTIKHIVSETRDQPQTNKKDFSKINLRDSDFKGVTVHDGKFNSSDLRGSDFSGADLSNSSFKYSDLGNVKFDGADLTGTKLTMANLKNASFKRTILDHADFSFSSLSDVCFENLKLNGTIFKYAGLAGTSFKNTVFRNVSFKYADPKKAIFNGATMDKLTYAVLKGQKAGLANVTVI